MKLIMFSSFYFLINLNVLAGLSASEIVKKADLKRGLGNISHSFNVTITNSGDQKIEVYKVKFKDITSSLTEQKEPERARGRKMLMRDYDIWLFTPNIKKALRISLDQKLTGLVANGDIANTNYANDYDATLLETTKFENKEVYKLELKAKNKKVTYGRIEYLVETKDCNPLEATFYALSGKPLKKAQFLDFKNIHGAIRSSKMMIQDYLTKDKASTLVFSDHKLEEFEESTFNKDRLEF